MFSFKRFSEQFKILWMQNVQKQGIILITITLAYMFFHFMMFYSGKNEIYLNFSVWSIFLTVMVIMNSLSVFSALLKPNASIHYYMIPASIGEKYAAAWLFSSIFTIVFYGTVISIVHLVLMYIGNTITGQSLSLDFPNLTSIRDTFFSLMIYQSLFFLAAVVFRKNPFWKMVLALIIISTIMSSISAAFLISNFQGSNALNSSDMANYSNNMNFQNMHNLNFLEKLEEYKILIICIATSIPFILWIVAYLRLKTREV